jgi:hypothetical protein
MFGEQLLAFFGSVGAVLFASATVEAWGPNLVSPNAKEEVQPSAHSLCGGSVDEFEVKVEPQFQGSRIKASAIVTNRTGKSLMVGAVAQLLDLEGRVVVALPPAISGRAIEVAPTRLPDTGFATVPPGYYTLETTALGTGNSGERSARDLIYVHCDGQTARVVDFAEWYFNSGSAEYGANPEGGK